MNLSSRFQSCFLKGSMKLILIFLIFTLSKSNPLITIYSSNQRILKETIDDLTLAVKGVKAESFDLSKNEVIIDKMDDQTTTKGKLFSFSSESPLFLPFDCNGTIADTDVILTNNDNENVFQIDLLFNYSIFRNETLSVGQGAIRLTTNIFQFKKAFQKNVTGYVMTPEFTLNFKYFDTRIIEIKPELIELQKFLNSELKTNEVIKTMALGLAENIEFNVEKYFTNNIVEYYEISLKNKPNNPYTFSITPFENPEAINKNTSAGQQYYLDGRIYNLDGSQIPELNYTSTGTPVEKIPFDYNITTDRQVFLNTKIFSDLMKVDFLRTGEFSIYEDKVDLSLTPFRFNIDYLSNFLPGINQVYSNVQKFSVEIKIKDVIYNYGDADINDKYPKYESYVIIESDVFFKTVDIMAGEIVLDISLSTKAYLDVFRPVNTNKFNIIFRENIEILKCVPNRFTGYFFDIEKFVAEFARAYTITNIGKFDFTLFSHEILLKDLIGENHEILKDLKGIILYEIPAPSTNKASELKFLN